MENLEAKCARLDARLAILEAEAEIRRLMARYMSLCDCPAQAPAGKLDDLFCSDAVWEGVGPRYAGEYGRHEGRERIVAFFESFAQRGARFAFNAHFLTSESIEVDGSCAIGWWMLLQPCTYTDGESHLIGARLQITFRREAGRWRIAHFRTENLFGRIELGAWAAGGSHSRAITGGK